MEAGLMELVQCLNKSWIYDTYLSLYIGRKSPRGMSRRNCSKTL